MRCRAVVGAFLAAAHSVMVLSSAPARATDFTLPSATDSSVIRLSDHAGKVVLIASSKGWATFFVTRDGKVFKKIVDSIDNGLEATVFPKYAEHLTKSGSIALLRR